MDKGIQLMQCELQRGSLIASGMISISIHGMLENK